MVFETIAELIAERNEIDVSEIKRETLFSDLPISHVW